MKTTTIQTTTKDIQWIPIKQWFIEQAAIHGLCRQHFVNLYYGGRIPKPKLRRVNQRVVLVRVPV